MKVTLEIDDALVFTIVSNVRSVIAIKLSDEEIMQLFLKYINSMTFEAAMASGTFTGNFIPDIKEKERERES